MKLKRAKNIEKYTSEKSEEAIEGILKRKQTQKRKSLDNISDDLHIDI